jgi:methionyl-tRNA formyltransferase
VAEAPILRVAFAGTPEFARVALASIAAAGHAVPLVLTQPDRPAGRGLKLQPSPVKQLAQALGVPVAQPRGLRLDGRFGDDARAAQAALADAAPDVLVVAAYGLILPRRVLETPRLGCLNIHASLLPRWRGAAPIERAIEAGDATTGVTIMQMDEGLDTGAICLAEALPIGADDTAATLHARLAALGARLVVDALRRAAAGALACAAQPADGVTYAHKIDKAQARIDWTADATAIERRARAFDPAPGLRFDACGEAVKLWRAAVRDDAPGTPGAAPGTVIVAGGGRLTVACGRGALDLLELQRPGGRRVGASAFLQSHPLAVGSVLGPGH